MRKRFMIVSAILLIAAGCAKWKTPITPSQAVTLQVSRSVVALAEANEVARATAVELFKNKWLGKEDTAEIMRWNLAVAGTVKIMAATLESPKPWAQKSAEMLAQLQTLTLPPAAQRVIMNPTTNLAVQTFATALATVQSIMLSIQAGVRP